MLPLLLDLLKRFAPQIGIAFAAFIAGGYAAWQIQGMRLDDLREDYATYQLAVESAAARAEREALAKEKAWLLEKENAQKLAVEREQKLQKDVAAAASAADRLRVTLANRRQLPGSAGPSCPIPADPVADVLMDCVTDYRRMAEAADRHASDAQTLMQAWPK